MQGDGPGNRFDARHGSVVETRGDVAFQGALNTGDDQLVGVVLIQAVDGHEIDLLKITLFLSG